MDVSVITLATLMSESLSGSEPWNSGGYSIEPTPMIVPWPCISRGTEWLVPIVPGLVRVMVVPAKSSTASLPARAFFTICSYAAQNCAKSSVSQFLMLGTRSCRVPSSLGRSMARPRFTCFGTSTAGLPLTSS